MSALTTAWPAARMVLVATCVVAAVLAMFQNLAGTAVLVPALGVGALGAALMLWAALRPIPGSAALWVLVTGAALTSGVAAVHPDFAALSASGRASWIACASAGVLVVLSVLHWSDRPATGRST